MSTVDAAIINHITNGGSSGGGGGTGVSYTAGDGISLTNNKIAVKYNTNTMEIVNGALSAKVSSSGGGSSGGSGGEEILGAITGLETQPSSTFLHYRGLQKLDVLTGLRLRLYNKTKSRDEDYVLIMSKYVFPTEGKISETNAIFVPLNLDNGPPYEPIHVATYDNAGNNYALRLSIDGTNYIYRDDEEFKYGLFKVQQHCLRTLTLIQQSDIIYRLLPHLDLIDYFEKTIEDLKKEAGL